MNFKKEFSNKIVLITGGTKGIGKGIAESFLKEKANVIVCGRNKPNSLPTVSGLKAEFIKCNVKDPDQIKKMFSTILKKKKSIDILVNNAGFGILGNHTEMQSERQLQMIDLNIHALTKLTHEFSNRMVKKGSGKIMNVASIAAYISGPGFAVYCATKAYVLSYSRALHKELKNRGVTVTALCPGYVVTGFQEVAGMKLSRMEKLSAVPANKVANIAIKSMRKGRREVMPGIVNKPLPLVTRITPMWLQLIIVNQLLK